MSTYEQLQTVIRAQRAQVQVDSLIPSVWRDLNDARTYGTRDRADAVKQELRDLIAVRRALQGRETRR